MCELGDDRSLLAIDEPELHLHPGLIARTVHMLEEVAETTPVVVATHSEAFLNALSNPAKSIVLCEQDEHGATQLRRPNEQQLAKWLENYSGYGAIRSDGFEQHVYGDSE